MAQVRKLQSGLTLTHYDYNNRSLSSGNAWGMVGSGEDTMDSRLLNYATSLKTQTEEIANLYAKGNTRFHNLPKSVESYVKANQDLGTFIRQVESGQYTNDPITGYNALIRIAGTILPDSEAPKFIEYFLDYLPKKSQKDINIENLKKSGYEVISILDSGLSQDYQDYLTKSKVNLIRKDGNLYTVNDDYSSKVPLKGYINLDWRTRGLESSSYNNYIFTDLNGVIHTGNYGSLNPDDDPDLYDAISNLIEQTRSDRGKTFTIYNKGINPNLNYLGDNKLLSLLPRESLNNFVDVSPLFKGNKQVIALNTSGVNSDSGTIEFSPDTIFYTLDNNGNITAPIRWDDPNLESILGQYNPNGWREAENQIGNLIQGLSFKDTTITSDLVKNPQEWANRMLDIMSKPRSGVNGRTTEDIKELEKYKSFGNPENALSYILALLQEGVITLDEDRAKKWHKLTEKYRTSGLVEGAVDLTEDEQDLRLIEEANKAGYSSVAGYKSSQRTLSDGLSGYDYLRLTAIAADLGSLIWSVSDPEPLSNVVGSGLAGVASTGLNAWADFGDEGISAKDAWKNLGINLGFDVLGVIPGGQSAKIWKNLARIIGRNIPLALGAIELFENKDEYKKSLDLLLNNPSQLTVQDFHRLSAIVNVLLRQGKQNHGGKRIKNSDAMMFSSRPAARKTEELVKEVPLRIKSSYLNAKNKIRGIKTNASTTTTPSSSTASSPQVTNPSSSVITTPTPSGNLNLLALPAGSQRRQRAYAILNLLKSGGTLDRFGEYLKSHK